MSSVQFTFPKYKLTAQLKEPGGMAVADAVAAAQSNLAVLAPPCLNELRTMTGEALAAYRNFPKTFSREALDQLYAAAARPIGLGAVCGLPGADAAFASLCDLVDRFCGAGCWDLSAIEVHLSTVQLFVFGAGQQLQAGSAEQLLAGLRKVSARYAHLRTPRVAAAS
jgi:hypothetical protein